MLLCLGPTITPRPLYRPPRFSRKAHLVPMHSESVSCSASASAGEDGIHEKSPLVRRKRRPDISYSAEPHRDYRSFRRDVGHAAAETFLLTRLTLILLRYLGVGYKWITKFLALACYAVLLMPGFLQVAFYYFFSSQVRRSVVYGEQPRNRLDLYIPLDTNGLKPVVAFVTGGAWIIGYKAWGSLLGRRLSERGIIVACIDYRNFPQGTISDMVNDASQGISFVCNNIASFGGDPDSPATFQGEDEAQNSPVQDAYIPYNTAYPDVRDHEAHISPVQDAYIPYNLPYPNVHERGAFDIHVENRIYLVGQSAGAHIAACALLDQAIKECGEGENTTWSVSQIKAFFGLSGGYNMLKLVDHFHGRGLYRSIFLSIMGGEEGLKRFSPELVVQDLRYRRAASLLPQIILFHGTSDYSIPSDESETFALALQNIGVQVRLVLYEGKTHTDLFLQDPLRGGRDELVEDIVSAIHASDVVSSVKDTEAPIARRLVPEFMLQLARRISPF